VETEQDTTQDTVEEKQRVYLTFDDGPSIYTGQILDVLAANDVKATFFVIGRDEEYYEYYKRIVAEGHTIGMHSYSHVYQDLYASLDSFDEELTSLNDLIYEVTGTRSTIFRFPGGSSNQVSALPIEDYIAYLNEHNLQYYDWNALSGDAVTSGLSPEQLVNNIMNDVRKNEDSIVLMHDLQTTHTTVESLQLLIDTLKSEDYEILPIDEDTPLIQHVSCNSVEE
jgi:peptidoglycan/xylan/chitin deacetylase (PgdA/CDA1 family)